MYNNIKGEEIMKKQTTFWVILLVLILPIIFYLITGNKKNDISSKLENNKPKVLEFSSKYCVECQDLKKVLDPLEKKYDNKIEFIYIDITSTNEKEKELIQKYDVNVVPTMVLINENGKEKIIDGYVEPDIMEKHLKGLLN